jgi:hypothetical protein
MRSRLARTLGRGLPGGIRQDLFEPAVRDLETERLADRHRLGGRFALGVVWLFLDCWRLTPGYLLERRREAAVLPRAPGPALTPGSPRITDRRERFRPMFLYHVRHALRLLVRDRAFSAAAVLTLALGIGANVAVFAVLEAVMLRPLPYPNGHELLILNHRDDRTGITKAFIAIGDFVDLTARHRCSRASTPTAASTASSTDPATPSWLAACRRDRVCSRPCG